MSSIFIYHQSCASTTPADVNKRGLINNELSTSSVRLKWRVAKRFSGQLAAFLVKHLQEQFAEKQNDLQGSHENLKLSFSQVAPSKSLILM